MESSAVSCATARRRRIVLYGDSLTQRSFEPFGFGAALAGAFSRTCDVFNRGFGGYNSRWCARADLLEHAFGDDARYPGRIYLSTVLLGTNDATRYVKAESQARNRVSVELEEYEENMYTILRRAAEASEIVIAFSPPPVDEKRRRASQRKRWGKDWVGGAFEDHRPDIGKYSEALRRAVKRLDDEGYTWIYGCDLYSTFVNDEEGYADFFEDGVHFNSEGQMCVSDSLMRMLTYLNVKEPHWDSQGLEPDFPYGEALRVPKDATVTDDDVFHLHAELKARREREREQRQASRLVLGVQPQQMVSRK